MFDQLAYTYMSPTKYVKIKLVYGFVDSVTDYSLVLVFKNNSKQSVFTGLSVQTFLNDLLFKFLMPIRRLQSVIIKWKFISILYPKNSRNNLLMLPIPNTRGLNDSTTGFIHNLKVSLRFIGLSCPATINIYGIPDNVFSNELVSGDTSINTSSSIDVDDDEVLLAFSDCEQVFLKAHKFQSAMPPVSVSYVHTSRVVDHGKGTKLMKSGKSNKTKLKTSKPRSKLVYRAPVIAMHLY